MMTEWTPEASEYLEGYLKQVAALARNQGDDAEEIVSGLRDHVAHEVGPGTGEPVNIDALLAALANIGTPEQVASSEMPLRSSSRPATPATTAGSATPPPLPPPAASYPRTPQRAIRKNRSWTKYALVSFLILVGVIVLVAVNTIPATIILPALERSREAATRASCANNQKQIGLSLLMFANEHDGAYPPLSDQPGRLMFSLDIYPEFLSDPSFLFVCPSDENSPMIESNEDFIDDHAYYYVSHAITSEEEGLAYVEAYRAAALAGDGFDHDFVLEDGAALPRVSTELEGRSASEIPVLIEKPHHHEPTGGNVLYLDGHVEFLELGSRFPMTEAFLGALGSIDE
jgi:prepilin-type processing-associated H-X9-DG protein